MCCPRFVAIAEKRVDDALSSLQPCIETPGLAVSAEMELEYVGLLACPSDNLVHELIVVTNCLHRVTWLRRHLQLSWSQSLEPNLRDDLANLRRCDFCGKIQKALCGKKACVKRREQLAAAAITAQATQ